MRDKDFEEEDTQPVAISAAAKTGDDVVYDVEWAWDEQAGGEAVLRVTPVTRGKRSPPNDED